METKRRSLVKALSWRFIATFITMGIAYAITGKLDLALEIGLLDTTIKFAAYFGHERIWLRVRYGKLTADQHDYQI